MNNQFFFIKKIYDKWLEEIEILKEIEDYYSNDSNRLKEKNQLRKCTDFFRIHLVDITISYSNDFVEELKYKIKMALIKLDYQTKKNRKFNFSKKIKEFGENFINDLTILQKQNFDNNEKYIILKKLIKSFKNVLNQIYIINYS